MRVSSWHWGLIPIVIVVGGCLPGARVSLPASFLEQTGRPNPTFTALSPPTGETGQDVVAALRAEDPRFRGRAVPVFGVMDCHANPRCTVGPGGTDGGPARPVWVVVYPDCNDGEYVNVGGVALDVGWVVVDAVKGIAGGYQSNTPCSLGP